MAYKMKHLTSCVINAQILSTRWRDEQEVVKRMYIDRVEAEKVFARLEQAKVYKKKLDEEKKIKETR
jgi:hypothetical protein